MGENGRVRRRCPCVRVCGFRGNSTPRKRRALGHFGSAAGIPSRFFRSKERFHSSSRWVSARQPRTIVLGEATCEASLGASNRQAGRQTQMLTDRPPDQPTGSLPDRRAKMTRQGGNAKHGFRFSFCFPPPPFRETRASLQCRDRTRRVFTD